jgi:hypothetical protein
MKDLLKEDMRIFGLGRLYDRGFLTEGKLLEGGLLKGENELLKGGLVKRKELLKEN